MGSESLFKRPDGRGVQGYSRILLGMGLVLLVAVIWIMASSYTQRPTRYVSPPASAWPADAAAEKMAATAATALAGMQVASSQQEWQSSRDAFVALAAPSSPVAKAYSKRSYSPSAAAKGGGVQAGGVEWEIDYADDIGFVSLSVGWKAGGGQSGRSTVDLKPSADGKSWSVSGDGSGAFRD